MFMLKSLKLFLLKWKGRIQSRRGLLALRPSDGRLPKWRLLFNPVEYAKVLSVDKTRKDYRYQEPLPQQYDWKPYVWNLADSVPRELPGLPQNNTAIALIACDRTPYFERTVQSIAANEIVKTLPIYVFIDRHVDPKRDFTLDEQVVIARKFLPHCIVIKRPRNFGCGRNIIDARRQLFDNLGFEKSFVMEDDMVVSKTYFEYCLNLMSWSERRYDNVGAVQGWNFCRWNQEQKQSGLRTVVQTYGNWWGYLMKKEAWDAVKETIYTFEDLFLGGDYRLRPHRSVRYWFNLKMNGPPKIQGSRLFPFDGSTVTQANTYFDESPTGQDAATMHGFHINGYVRICPAVNRGLYIDRHGIHMNPQWFVRDGYDTIHLHEFEDDKTLREFHPLGEERMDSPAFPIEGGSSQKI